MLTDLVIRNFAIIDHLHATFAPGFNVLTGETGAGKSIIIDAVSLLLGGRARPEFIRSGEDAATLEAVLDLSTHPELLRDLSEAGFGEGDELLIKRVVSRSGKNRIFLNGSIATLGQLQEVTGNLVCIYGQHEHQSLQKSETHLLLLDRFAALECDLSAYRHLYEEKLRLTERLRHLQEAERERQRRLDMLVFQSREIEGVAPKSGEDEELAAERLLLQNSERLASATQGGYDVLYGDDDAVCGRLDSLASDLEALADVDPLFASLAESLRGALFSIEDVATQLRDYLRKISFEPGRLDTVEERLALLSGLKRKYAPTIEAILEYKLQIDREVEELSDLDAAKENLSARIAEADKSLRASGEAISRRRQEAALSLAEMVQTELADLAMPRARFEIRFEQNPEPGARGFERAEFFISPNPGEEPKPLARIASGGELSRFMLALKRAAPEGDGAVSLIFDEVDAGIGGEAATAVGQKLWGAARKAQVLCITHLPQVAAFADTHHKVEKKEESGRTLTTLSLLEGEERVREMARMLGGARVTDRTLEHARELIGLSSCADR